MLKKKNTRIHVVRALEDLKYCRCCLKALPFFHVPFQWLVFISNELDRGGETQRFFLCFKKMQTLSPQSLRWKSNPLIVSESYVFNPKALNFQASSLSSPYRRTRNWRISSSSEENAANSSDGGDLKKSLSGIVGNQVEELLSREENKSLLDGLEKASMRVETAKRELAEIVRQELEAKLLQDYVDKLESRAAEVSHLILETKFDSLRFGI